MRVVAVTPERGIFGFSKPSVRPFRTEGSSIQAMGMLDFQCRSRSRATDDSPNAPDQPRGKPAPQAEVTPARVGL